MILQKELRKVFFDWYLQEPQKILYKTNALRGKDTVIKVRWLAKCDTERYGILVDFFDSKGIYINKLCPDSFEISYGFNTYYDESQVDRTRHEARVESINMASEILRLML